MLRRAFRNVAHNIDNDIESQRPRLTNMPTDHWKRLPAVDAEAYQRNYDRISADLLERRRAMHESSEEKKKITTLWKRDRQAYYGALHDLEEAAMKGMSLGKNIKYRAQRLSRYFAPAALVLSPWVVIIILMIIIHECAWACNVPQLVQAANGWLPTLLQLIVNFLFWIAVIARPGMFPEFLVTVKAAIGLFVFTTGCNILLTLGLSFIPGKPTVDCQSSSLGRLHLQ